MEGLRLSTSLKKKKRKKKHLYNTPLSPSSAAITFLDKPPKFPRTIPITHCTRLIHLSLKPAVSLLFYITISIVSPRHSRSQYSRPLPLPTKKKKIPLKAITYDFIFFTKNMVARPVSVTCEISYSFYFWLRSLHYSFITASTYPPHSFLVLG